MHEFITNDGVRMVRIGIYNWEVIVDERVNSTILHLDIGKPFKDDYYNMLYYLNDNILTIDGMMFKCEIDRLEQYVTDAVNGSGFELLPIYLYNPDDDIRIREF